jgi:gliding motility-associated lipoprotein GldD
MINNRTVFFFLLLSFFASCSGDETVTHNPRGYFRIDLPEKKYVQYQNDSFPYSFQYPSYATIEPYKGKINEKYFLNINFNKLKAKLHLSYKTVNNNLPQFLEESRGMAMQHQVKASALKENLVINLNSKVYGLIYELGGNTASSLQFYITDSTKNFMRGALYFFAHPNADSVAPVYDFIRTDIYHIIETFKWE